MTVPAPALSIEEELNAIELLFPNDDNATLSASPASPTAPSLPGVLIARLAAIDERGHFFVELPDEVSQLRGPARSVVPISQQSLGRSVVVAFEYGRIEAPVILGVLWKEANENSQSSQPLQATIDDQRIEIAAENEIVLRCGKASITLTRAGKVLIRGAYLLSRASGVNRIKGGSVQVN
jgi:hypothetical protein